MGLTFGTRTPSESIVPLFAVDDLNVAGLGRYLFLGTGAFVGERPLLATAEHVVRDWQGPFAIAILPRTGKLAPATPMPAKLVAKDPQADLALLEVPGYPREKALDLAQDSEIRMNKFVYCLEYSTTYAQRGAIHLSPATRVGNVTRLLDLRHRCGRAGDGALELSFPALRGASGAPIVSESFRVWGVVTANVDYHLLPSQIESVLDEKNQVYEETRYLLPQAIAVHPKHLRAMF